MAKYGKSTKWAYVAQPKYYNGFRCIGGGCSNSCCIGWKISWESDEIKKLKNSDCSEELRRLINTSFVESEEKIKLKENGRCPFLTDDNFCAIQRELGEEYLSSTCRTYPRNTRVLSETVVRCCNMSCPETMKALCNNEDALEMENILHEGTIKADVAERKLTRIHPELAYHYEILLFLYDIISDKSRSAEASLILGAIAAKKLTERIANKQTDDLPGYLEALKKQLNNAEQIEKLENIKTNYSIKLGFGSKLLQTIKELKLDKFFADETGTLNIDIYNNGVAAFNEMFADRPYVIRNIALNLLIEMNIPFFDSDKSVYDNYCYYVVSVAAVKLLGAAIAVHKKEELFNIYVAYIDRAICHNKDKFIPVLDLLKEYNCTSPAYLALLLK